MSTCSIIHHVVMKLFIDSANIEEIRKAAKWGIIEGVTTNPSLIAKEKGDFRAIVSEICTLIDGPISAEVMAETVAEMIAEARSLAEWHKNIVIKIPCTFDGLTVARKLEAENISTNVTLVFSPNQVLLAALAGASFISPFVGRLDDAGENGLNMIARSLKILKNYGFASQIIAASIRSPLTVALSAELGTHIATVPFKILEQMIAHPLTDVGIERFKREWRASSK